MIGNLSAYEAKEQTWEEYCEILEQYFEANGIDNGEKQRAILISVVGRATYRLMRNLLSPDKPSSKTYDELKVLMQNHFSPKPSEIVQRYKFDSRSRQPNETVSEYVAELRQIAHDCNYGQTLEQMLRDRLVCGINDDRIQRRLLAETDLTFEKAYKMAVAAEAASRNVIDLQAKAAGNVNQVKTEAGAGAREDERGNDGYKGYKPRECYRCNGKHHMAAECKFKEAKCHNCGKVGHISKACRSQRREGARAKEKKAPKAEPRGSRTHRSHAVKEKADESEEDSSQESEEAYTMACMNTTGTGIKKVAPFEVKMEGQGRKRDRQATGEGIISPVKYAEWAAPIVPVLKPDGSIRICGDYKLTVNNASSLEQYPIPRVDDLFNTLEGGKQFSKLDLSHAYQQIVMDEDSKQYLTVNTHRGLFTYNRLPFGVSSAPAIFQRTMESILQGLPRVAVYLDDILLTGSDEAEHLRTLDEVLRRLREAGLRLRRSKCAFLQDKVEYLGHKVDAEGLHPVENKVRAIEEAPAPTTVTELKAYLGLLNYYNKFLPNLATHLAPLHQLLRKDASWTWGREQEKAFQRSKQLLKSAKVLCHYSADRELVLACDASPYGVGALLSHVMEDGSEKPLGFMSRTLTPAEKRYSQLDKEGLAIMFGIKRFHKYLYGRTFTISTDHKPLISLFHEKKPVPQMCSPRVQRWAVLLRAYEYKIVYKPGKEHANADALSRLPLPQTAEEDDTDQVLMIDVMDDSPVTTTQVRKWTAKDKTLSQVHEWCLKGWSREVDSPYKPYSQRRLELSVKDGCVLWGARVVIPKRGRGSVLKQLHNTHPGISRMKGLARSYVWWPGMDMEIEQEVQSCLACQETRKCPARAPLHPWEWPEVPWSRLHIDYAGPFQGKMFLVIVDAHSKWIDVYPTSSATSETTIEKLRQCFSTHGLPQMIVSDNGTCFTSAEFELFMQKNGIQHVTSAPFHPASNGLAERAVQTFKEGLKKAKGGTMETKLARFLFNYRITPQTTTGLSPAEMLMSRRLRSTLDLLLPDVKSRVRRNQLRQKEQHDGHSKWRGFSPGEEVYVRNYSYGPKWILGRVEKCTGPVSYRVRTGDGQSKRRHVDQIRKRHVAETNDMTASGGAGEPSSLQGHAPSAETLTEDPGVSSPCGESVTVPEMVPEEPPAVPPLDRRAESSPVLRRSERTRQAPAHLKDFVP
ncbi:hypothetical protein SKAU_G00233260 [Synaphobranchus kaupii]|uniref:Gypsy retrotransposon integrase-like protein 1 n=1 Tax=Synaphobranchus kaupii TaxID=118154 RepID=A0A9Q1ISK1_SYNKA|nr:hypothetical protein SKAU_G00233260 [Synaphobranchus kaupii]